MCGEMAGDPLAIPYLVGMDLDYFSMSASSILNAKKVVRSLNFSECVAKLNKALNMDTEQQVKDLK
jgi:phosphotransferase system enzyme I (PtsI)